MSLGSNVVRLSALDAASVALAREVNPQTIREQAEEIRRLTSELAKAMASLADERREKRALRQSIDDIYTALQTKCVEIDGEAMTLYHAYETDGIGWELAPCGNPGCADDDHHRGER